MKKIYFKKYLGKQVVVSFLDHAIGTKTPALCKAIGTVVHFDAVKLLLRYWHCTDDSMDNDLNNEYISIVSPTISAIKILK